MEHNLKAKRNALRSAYIELIEGFNPNAFVTLALNKSSTVEEVTRLVGRFCGIMDRRLLGHTWHKLSPDRRTDGVFLIEHVGTNIHAHGILRFPIDDLSVLDAQIMLVWNRLTEAGTTDAKAITDTNRLARYCTKEIPGFVYDADQVVLPRQFMNG
ncbi:hypothetical protein ACO34A_15590 [Rhizobium sp. ACO-34A]|nr:hypothetical protein [Rhizobium sp. ACO-34A]ATN35226.1 hypothetical protein ACO34A_15590 [Rhizobium sp. ACO-34A]